MITYIVNKLNRGGAEKQLLYIIKHLEHIHSGSIITLYDEGDFEGPFKAMGIPVYHVNIKGALFSPFNIIRLFKLINYIKCQNPEIIHSWLYHSNLIAAVIKVFIRGVRLITSKRGSNYWYKRKHFVVNKFIYNKSDLIMVNTKALKKEILQYANVKNKIRVIPNGIETDIKKDEIADIDFISQIREGGKIVIGCVARFAPQKRYEITIKAAKILGQDLRNIHFVLVGGRGNIEDCQALVCKLGLRDHITFTGEVDDVYPYIKGFDVFLMSSSAEGMPNALMEAMLMGKPVIATNVGGIPDLVEDGVNGILVPPLKPDEIAGAIRRLLKDEGMMRKFSSNNLVKIRGFSNATMVSTVGEMYKSVLS